MSKMGNHLKKKKGGIEGLKKKKVMEIFIFF